MKKTMKKAIGVFAASACLVLAFNTPALAGAETEWIENSDLTMGDFKTEFVMDGTEAEKVFVFEDDIMDYMCEKNLDFVIDFDGIKMSFSPDAFKTDKYVLEKKRNSTLGYKLVVDTKAYVDDWKYPINTMGNSEIMRGHGLSVEAWIMVDGRTTHKIDKLNSPIKVEVNYDYTEIPYYMDEAATSYYWTDLEKAGQTSKLEWEKIPTNVDTAKKVLTMELTKGFGNYEVYLSKKSAQPKPVVPEQGGLVGLEKLDGHWAKWPVENLANKKLISGDLNEIEINAPITREMFVYYVVTVLGIDENLSDTSKFKDVTADNKYKNQIYTACNSGIINGISENEFNPKANITRQEVTTILNRVLEKYKANVVVTIDPAFKDLKDFDTIAPWAKDASEKMFSLGIMKGRETGFAPKGNTTWAETMAILNNFLGI